jgi:rhodanese-related sulfurtransferase
MGIPRILKESLLIVLAATALALVTNALRPDGLPLREPFRPPAPGDGGVPRISLEEAAGRFAAGAAVFVDARPEADFRQGRIDGALHLPDAAFDDAIGPFFEAVAPETPVIAYCDGATCPLAESVAKKLIEIGYADVSYLPDGWRQWREAGLPTASGEADAAPSSESP